MRDDVFDVPIGLLRELDAMPSDSIAYNGRPMYTGVCLSAVTHRLLLEGDGLVDRCVVVSSYATFGCLWFGPVAQVGPDWFADLSDALGFVDWHSVADAAWLYDDIGFHGHEYEVWHIVADPVTAPVAAVDAVPGSSRAARGGSVSGALTGEHAGVFEVPVSQFLTWCHEHEHGADCYVLTWYPDLDEWVQRSPGVCLHDSSLVHVGVGDWLMVYTCAGFGFAALDVWARRVPDDAVDHVLEVRELSQFSALRGIGYEIEYWHIVDDPRPLWPVAIVWMPSSDVWVHGCEWVRIVPRADFCGCLSDDAVYRVDDRTGVWNELMVALMDIDESGCHNVYEDEIAAICDGLSKCDNARTSDGGTYPFWIVCYDELEALGIDLVFGFALDDAGKSIVPPEYARARFDDHYWDEKPEPQPADTWYEIDLFGPEVV